MVADNNSWTHFSKSSRGLPTRWRRAGFASKQHGTEWIRFRQSEDIYIQRQLSPRLGKRGGQLSSSTSIHYVSIKKSNGDRRTHRHPNCHTGKPRSGSEVHLLLNNQETLWDFFAKSLSGGSNLPDVLSVTVCTLWAFKLDLIMRLVFDLCSKRQALLMNTSQSVKYQ